MYRMQQLWSFMMQNVLVFHNCISFEAGSVEEKINHIRFLLANPKTDVGKERMKIMTETNDGFY